MIRQETRYGGCYGWGYAPLPVAALLVGMTAATPQTIATPGAAAASSRLQASLGGYNVLLITLDTLRADRLGAYGYEGAATPHIDALAAEGVRFDRATTSVPVTLPAHASIMTGQYPFSHGVRNNASFFLPGDALTLAEVFSSAGYATGGFIGAVVLDAQFGIAQGFETFGDLARYQSASGDGSGERPGEDVVREATAWIEQQAEPFFAWVHMYDPHDPYAPPEPYRSRYAQNPYDGEIAYVDEMVGRLRAELESSGRADNTLIVLAADHGEGLGDHREEGHSFFVYDSTVHVPLIFWAPAAIPAGGVVESEVSVVDIFPTVVSLLGLPSPTTTSTGTIDGADLRGHLDGAGPEAGGAPQATPPVYTESLIPRLDFGWSELRAVLADGYKYIEAPRPELYELGVDPGEETNLVDADPDRAARMAAVLAGMIGADDATGSGASTAGAAGAGAAEPAVDAETLDRLRSLGYIGGAGGGAEDTQIDPKDKVEVYESFVAGLLEAIAAIADERFGDANDSLVALDDMVPDQYIVYYYFGQLALEAGDPETSVGVLRRALELNPSYLPTYTELANAMYVAGDARGGQEFLRQARSKFPDNFPLILMSGVFHHDAGELAAALEYYDEAARLRPDDPDLLERRAHVHLLRREWGKSLDALRRLTEITPQAAPAWAQLAFVLAQNGEAEEAQAALDRALELDPDDPTVVQVLGQLR